MPAPANMRSEVSPSLPLRLLTKGPSYLRSQMEGDRRGRPSAVERLAADKAKYVKSQAARACSLEPSGLGSSASEEDSSSGSGACSSTETYLGPSGRRQTGQQELQPSIVRRSGSKRQLRPDSLVIYRQKCEFVRGAVATSSSRSSKGNRSLVRRLLPGSGGRADRQQQSAGAATCVGGGSADGTEPAPPQGASQGAPAAAPAAPQGVLAAAPAAPQGVLAAAPAAPQGVPAAAPAAPQGAAAAPAAPQGAAAAAPAAPQGAAAAAPAAPQGAAAAAPAAPQGAAAAAPAAPQGAAAAAPAAPQGAAAGRTKEPVKRRGGGAGLQRSHSDLSCRYSRACSGLDSFFEHCGLEPDVMEALTREKFAAASDSLVLKFRSVSSPDSESELSHHSNSSGGSQRLRGQNKPPPSALSVIERNARVIQWLYGCKRAQESKGKAAAVLV